jgi:hypothetical protein
MIIRWLVLSGAVALCSTVSSFCFAEEVLYCVDNAVTGFKWEKDGASPTNFAPYRFTVKIGPAQGKLPLMSNNERLITQTSEGFLQGVPKIYECETHPYKTLCTKTDSGAATEPWLFAADGHYVRAFIAGGPPGSELDPNIAIGYGTCTKF